MAKLKFTKGNIKGIVTTVGDQCLTMEDQKVMFNFSDDELNKLKKNLGLKSRSVVSDFTVTTSDLCVQSTNDLFKNLKVDPSTVDALLFVTQTPDYRAPSTAIHIAHRLGCTTDVMAFDVSLGCSGYVYGLSLAFSLIESGLKNVLLLTGDVASHFSNKNDKTFAPLMGDAGSATWIECDEESKNETFFCLFSDGAGYNSLIIPGSGTRQSFDPALPLNYMHMNGAEVFNFTIKVVPKMFDEILDFARCGKEEIDFYVLHQPNKYILSSIQKRLKLSDKQIPSETQAIYGNQNSASIPGTINGFLSNEFSATEAKKVIFAGFGIGLSWGACVTNIEGIYAPLPLIFRKSESV